MIGNEPKEQPILELPMEDVYDEYGISDCLSDDDLLLREVIRGDADLLFLHSCLEEILK